MKRRSNVWKMLALLLPVVGVCGEFDDAAARFRAEPDIHRRAEIVARINAPQATTEVRAVTNTAPPAVLVKVQQLGRILTNFAAVTAQTGVNYEALKEYALANAADMTPAQHAMLLTCDRLWAEVKDYAPDGLSNFRPVTTNSVTVLIPAPSLAEQRLGRAATAEDMK